MPSVKLQGTLVRMICLGKFLDHSVLESNLKLNQYSNKF